MSTGSNIIKRLHGVKDEPEHINEASFQVNEKKYTSGFGNYFCNGNPIAKEEYEKARDVYMFKPDRDAKVRKARKESDEDTRNVLDKAMQLGAKKPARNYGTKYGYDKQGEFKYCYAKGDILPKTESSQDVARAIDDLFDAAVYNLCTTKKGYNDIYSDATKIMQDAIGVELPTTTALKFDYMKILDTHHNKYSQIHEGHGVSTEDSIIARLLESRYEDNEDEDDLPDEDLEESGFTANGKVYKSGFGRYSCDGKPISRDEYAQARQDYDAAKVEPKKDTSKDDRPTTARKDYYGTGNFKELGKGSFQDDMTFLVHKVKNGATVKIRYGDKSEVYARKAGRGWKTDSDTWIDANAIASAARDGAQVKVNYMVKSTVETDYDRPLKQDKEKMDKTPEADLDQVNRHSAKRSGDFMAKLYHDATHKPKDKDGN